MKLTGLSMWIEINKINQMKTNLILAKVFRARRREWVKVRAIFKSNLITKRDYETRKRTEIFMQKFSHFMLPTQPHRGFSSEKNTLYVSY